MSSFKKDDEVVRISGSNRGRKARVMWCRKMMSGEVNVAVVYSKGGQGHGCDPKNYVLASEYKPGKPHKPSPGSVMQAKRVLTDERKIIEFENERYIPLSDWILPSRFVRYLIREGFLEKASWKLAVYKIKKDITELE